MSFFDLHVHSDFCDGKDSLEEIVLAAIEKNMSCIGFSCHSYTYFDESYCIKKDKIDEYIYLIKELKEKYKDKIKIFCGTEKDYYSKMNTDLFDYVIGSVHYLKINDKFYELDSNKEDFIKLAKEQFNNDYYKLAEKYFETVVCMAKELKPDIIGHLDLITKFNENYNLFDEQDERYKNALKNTIDELLKLNIFFEINTGAISRGYKSKPYPNIKTIKYIKDNNGKFLLSSDSHQKETLCFNFEEYSKYLTKK